MSNLTKLKTKIGAHVSVAGGIDKAPQRASDLGCETFQCFTRPPQGGPAPTLTQTIISNFKLAMKNAGFETFYIHTPYYINFASLNPRIRHGSIKVVREELERGSVLGARFIMTHLGSHSGQTLEEGIKKVSKAVTEILDGYKGSTELLLEISAGAGNIIGDSFEELAGILNGLDKMSLKKLGGICFDTCHAFASGYDFRSPEKAAEIMKDFNKKIGFEYLKLSHVNDSKVKLGERKDRHEHIGKGLIGEDGLASILRTPRFLEIDWILETEDEGREEDVEKLKGIKEASKLIS